MGSTYIRFGINNTALVESTDRHSTVKNLGYILHDYGTEKARSLLCGDDYRKASGYPYHKSLGCHAIWHEIDGCEWASTSKKSHGDIAGMDGVGFFRKWEGHEVYRGYEKPDYFITVMADGSVFCSNADPLAGTYKDLAY